jgi:hypothetical protein
VRWGAGGGKPEAGGSPVLGQRWLYNETLSQEKKKGEKTLKQSIRPKLRPLQRIKNL